MQALYNCLISWEYIGPMYLMKHIDIRLLRITTLSFIILSFPISIIIIIRIDILCISDPDLVYHVISTFSMIIFWMFHIINCWLAIYFMVILGKKIKVRDNICREGRNKFVSYINGYDNEEWTMILEANYILTNRKDEITKKSLQFNHLHQGEAAACQECEQMDCSICL